MPMEFHKIMDQNLHVLLNKYAFTDDVLVVTERTETEHWKKYKKVLERLDAMNIQLNLDIWKLAEKNA